MVNLKLTSDQEMDGLWVNNKGEWIKSTPLLIEFFVKAKSLYDHLCGEVIKILIN